MPHLIDGAADRQIRQALLDEREHFVALGFGEDEVGLFLVEIQQLLLERGQFEVVVLFGDGFGGASAFGARVARFRVVHVELIEHAILAGVAAFVDVAVVEAAAEQILHLDGVLGGGGALETVDAEAQDFPLALEFGGNDVGEFLRRFAGGCGGALDLLAVLIGAGGEHNVVTLHALPALNGIGGDGGVGVADVRRGVHVIDRSGEVIFHFLTFK